MENTQSRATRWHHLCLVVCTVATEITNNIYRYVILVYAHSINYQTMIIWEEKNIYAKFHSADINANRESTMVSSIFQFVGIISLFG